jgi:hypothetical protein
MLLFFVGLAIANAAFIAAGVPRLGMGRRRLTGSSIGTMNTQNVGALSDGA